MTTEGSFSNGDGENAGATDNVVLFPRDWLGPREELVPFGPRASGEVVEFAVSGPTSAADFWGEGSAAIHDAVEAPARVAAAVAAPVRPTPQRKSWRLARPRAPQLPRVSVLVPRVHIPRRVVAGCGTAGLLVIAVALASIGGPGHVRVLSAAALDGSAALDQSPGLSAILAHRSVDVSAMRARARHRTRAARSRPLAVQPQTTRTQTESQPAVTTSRATAPTDSAPAPAEATVASAGSSGGQTGSPAGPVGAGAPFGPGHLG